MTDHISLIQKNMPKCIPFDVMPLILEYEGSYKIRDGRLCKQIKQNDRRREMLIKKPVAYMYLNDDRTFYRSWHFRLDDLNRSCRVFQREVRQDKLNRSINISVRVPSRWSTNSFMVLE